MKLVSYVGGFGRLDGDVVVPMGDDLVAFLAGAPVVEGERTPYREVRAVAPVPRPGKIVCVGLNYRDHAAETGTPVPTEPVLFAKFANSVVGDGATVGIPPATTEVDWEAELGVVIGSTTRRVTPERALDHVAGYVVLNDLSARDLQRRGGQWTRGKAVDGFLPMGRTSSPPTRCPTRRRSASAARSTARPCTTPRPGRWCSVSPSWSPRSAGR
jgi:2-keto-4-pentenoate hydratase/2-oxohepta-3-ene-1,7-dioic acid hydratase in catechol pathway